MGGVAVSLAEVMEEISDPAPTWVTLVPTRWNEFEQKRLEKGEPFYPRERYVRILHDMWVGTVEQLVEHLRENLVRTFDALACKQPDGSWGTIPAFGEASMRKQEKALDDYGVKGFSPGPFKAGRMAQVVRQQQRNRMDGYEPDQSPFERDVLMRLVSQYLDRRWPEHTYDRFGGGPHPPTDNPGAVQALIDALEQLKRDGEGRERAATERSADKKIDIPQGGTDVAGEIAAQAAQEVRPAAAAGGP